MARSNLILAIIFSLFFTFYGRESFSQEGGEGNQSKETMLDAFIEKSIKEYKVPGVAVAVVKDGKVAYLKGFGLRKIGTEEKVDENTIFQLASVTKTFTAASVGVMVDKGKISFDQKVIEVLPGFALMQPYPTRYTTPRDLLAHRTGLGAFKGDLLGELGYDRDEVLRRLRYINPSHSFREAAAYSNVGYFVAGQLAAKANDSTWEDVVRNYLLNPLKMKRSGFTTDIKGMDNVAAPHGKVNAEIQLVRRDLQQVLAPAGAMISTAADMSHYMQMLLDGGRYKDRPVLKADTIAKMFAPSMVETPGFAELPPISAHTGFSFGMGWGNFHYQGYEILEKGGALAGVRTTVVLVPELDLGITVLANLNLTALPEAIRTHILSQYLGVPDDDMQAEIRKRAAMLENLVGVSPPPPQDPKPPSRDLTAFVGKYQNELYGTFSVAQDQQKLKVEAGPGRYPGSLEHWNYDTFLLKWPAVNVGDDELRFVIDGAGEVTEFVTESYGTFRKVADAGN